MVESELPNCPDGRTLETLAGDTLELADRPAVEAHVEGCSTCRERLAMIIGDSPTNKLDSEQIIAKLSLLRSEPADLPQVGDVIVGKYRVDGVIGRGGMGTVLGARHIELGHLVAIKVLHSRTPLATPRFLREARTCVRLSGEHVVRVFDYGKLAHGSPFLVMEHLQGEDLAKVIAHGLVPIDTCIRYVIETCEALEEAHALGVVHRDLKPGNLFVVCDAKGETRIKVLDFGISKSLGFEGDTSSLTESDAVMGSPLYMSPEQVRASRDVDARTDIWAVGVVLYELVTGRSPFAAPSAPAVAVKIAASTPKPLSEARAGITAALEAVVNRCLEKDPASRYQSVSELAEALRRVLPAYQVQPVAPARRLGWVLAASALAVVLAASLFWALTRGTEQQVQASTRPPPAVLPPPAAVTTAQAPSPAAGSGAQPLKSLAPTPQPVVHPAAESGAEAPRSNPAVPAQEIERTRHSLDIGEVLPP